MTCIVQGQNCNFARRGDYQILLKDGIIGLNGWQAVSVKESAVDWQKANQKMAWHRISDPKDAVDALNGVWRTSDNLICIVIAGSVNFICRGDYQIAFQNDFFTLNGWSACGILADTVRWQKAAQKMEWQRCKDPKDVKALEGTWKNSDGLTCTVADGVCTFSSRPTGHTLAIQDGLLNLNGWTSTNVMRTSAKWRKADKIMEWMRIEDTKVAAGANSTKK